MPSDMPNVQEEGFRSSLFGFDKNDVLAYMNALANEAQQQALTYQEQIHEMEAQVDKLKKDQSNARACVEKLQVDYADAVDRADRAEQQAEKNARDKIMAEERMNGFRTQCVENDKALESLQSENDKLKKQVEALIERQNKEKAEREAEQATAAAALHEAQAAAEEARHAVVADSRAPVAAPPVTPPAPMNEEARIEARKILEDAKLYAENARAALDRQAAEQKARMSDNACGIAAGVMLLRERLTRVDDKLGAATLDLENATSAIYKALDDTMKDIDSLSDRMHTYADGTPETDVLPVPPAIPEPTAPSEAPMAPAPEPKKHTPTLRPKPAARPVVQAKQRLRRTPHGRHAVSQSLLDALNRMDDDK